VTLNGGGGGEGGSVGGGGGSGCRGFLFSSISSVWHQKFNN